MLRGEGRGSNATPFVLRKVRMTTHHILFIHLIHDNHNHLNISSLKHIDIHHIPKAINSTHATPHARINITQRPRNTTQQPRSNHAATTQQPRSNHAATTQQPRSTTQQPRSTTQHHAAPPHNNTTLQHAATTQQYHAHAATPRTRSYTTQLRNHATTQ